MLRVWLIKISENLPIDGGIRRSYRTGLLAKALSEMGHKVVWWSSSYDHSKKKNRFDTDTTIQFSDHIRLKLLHSKYAYKKNVSGLRILNHYELERKFRKISESEPTPDIILSSVPTPGLAYAATQFGKKHGVPVILDLRDMWPDIFLDVLPKRVRGLARLGLWNSFYKIKKAARDSVGITGITPKFINWGLNYAGRPAGKFDRSFPISYLDVPPPDSAIEEGKRFWDNNGAGIAPCKFVVCFFGTLGATFDGDMVMDTASTLAKSHSNIQFVFCGQGDDLEYYRKMSEGLDNVFFAGFVGAGELWHLKRVSSVALMPIQNRKDYRMSLPNKVFEYLAAGLPILSSLGGSVEELILENRCGLVYKDAGELVGHLDKLERRPDLLKEMSENGRELYRESFVSDEVYRNMAAYMVEVSTEFPRSSIEKIHISGTMEI